MRKLFHEDTHGHGSGPAGEHKHPHAAGPASEEERLALLRYMLSHNAHHAEELHALAHGAPEAAEALLHEAVADIEASNQKIEEALALLTKE